MSDSRSLPSEVPFASFFAYSPRAVEGEKPDEALVGEKSRRLVRSIKNEAKQFSVKWKLAEFVKSNIGDELRELYLSANTTLVPMPGHAPLKDQASRWPARELCTEFIKVGLGGTWEQLLERRSRVTKAAFARAGERPTAQAHFDSFRCVPQIGVGQSITVFDDVITRGATMLAAVAALRLAYPGSEVKGFALMRTMSGVSLSKLVAPVNGVVRLEGKATKRRP